MLLWKQSRAGRLTLGLLAFERPVLHVRRETGGRITVAGIAAEGESDPAFAEWVFAQQQIRIRNATILWEDRLRGAPPLALEDLQFGLDNSGRRHRFGLSAVPPAALAARIDIRGEITGDLGEALEHLSGRIFVQLDYADLSAWRTWVDYPVDLPAGRGALRLWGDLAEGQGKLTADVALEELRLRLGRKLPELALESLRGRLSGRYRENDWAVAGSKLELLATDGTRVAPTDFQVEWKEQGRLARRRWLGQRQLSRSRRPRPAGRHLPLARTRSLLERLQPQGRVSGCGRPGKPGEDLERYALKANFSDQGCCPAARFREPKACPGWSVDRSRRFAALDARDAGVSLPRLSEPEISSVAGQKRQLEGEQRDRCPPRAPAVRECRCRRRGERQLSPRRAGAGDDRPRGVDHAG
jgi:hypothetical protein